MLEVNLTNKVKDLYTENYKILLKEIKVVISKWKDILYSQIGRLCIVKMSILPKVTYQFIVISIKMPTTLLKK